MHEHLRLQQRLVDQELEGDGEQRALLGRELEPEVFAQNHSGMRLSSRSSGPRS